MSKNILFSGIDTDQAETLEHFKYNPATNKLEADKPIETTLSSLHLGEQHTVSSGGENVFFTNEHSKVNWFPAWGGVTKGQNIKASARNYSELRVKTEPSGTNYFPFRELYENPENISVFEFSLVSGQALTAGEVLRYSVSVYDGAEADEIGSGTFQSNLQHEIYEEYITLEEDLDIGATLSIKFDHPVEIHAGAVIYDQMVIESTGGYFLALEGDRVNVFAQSIEYKNFTDENLVTEDAIENSSLEVYDIYVKSGYVGVSDGSSLYPYNTIDTAIANASDADSIFLDGQFILTTSITLPSDKSLYFYGTDTTEIKYATFDGANDKIFYQSSSSCTKEFKFTNINFFNSGDYAVYIRSASKVTFDTCDLANNGWSGNGLSTVLADDGSTLGYDSDQADLQAFWAGAETSNGGAMRIRSTPIVNIVDCKVYNNLRGLRIQDCGSGGYGYISRNQCYNNLESGIYLASGSYNASNGCENFTVYNNASKYNSNNGILVIGGINNVISLNVVEGNWNAGVMGWHVSNTRFRDMDLTNNNRSRHNGIGSVGDAHASISIAGGTLNPLASFIVDVLDTQVYNTGLGSNTSRVGLRISSNVSDINDVDKSLINVDDVGFKNQDYAVDVDARYVRIVNNGYVAITEFYAVY